MWKSLTDHASVITRNDFLSLDYDDDRDDNNNDDDDDDEVDVCKSYD